MFVYSRCVDSSIHPYSVAGSSIVQFFDRNDHVRPSRKDSKAVDVPLSYFTHVFPLVVTDIEECPAFDSVVHGPDAEPNKHDCHAANDNGKDVKREVGR